MKHFIPQLLTGAAGALLVYIGSGPWWVATANGAMWAFLFMFGSEYHDEMAHRAVGDRWHGWDWRDFLEGVLGGLVGALIVSGAWRLL